MEKINETKIEQSGNFTIMIYEYNYDVRLRQLGQNISITKSSIPALIEALQKISKKK